MIKFILFTIIFGCIFPFIRIELNSNCKINNSQKKYSSTNVNILKNQSIQIPKLSNYIIFNELYPGNNKFDKEGKLIIFKDPNYELRTEIGHKFIYKKNKVNKVCVVLINYLFENGKKATGHVNAPSIDIAIFTFSSQYKWVKTKFTENWIIPQVGYGSAPPLEMKIYKNTICLYEKFIGMYGPGSSEKDHSEIYQYYFDIESLKEVY